MQVSWLEMPILVSVFLSARWAKGQLILIFLSEVGSLGQQGTGTPRTLFPSHFFQLGGIQDVPWPDEVSSLSSVSWVFLGVSSQLDMPEALPCRGDLTRGLSSLKWVLSVWRSSGCTLSPSQITELLNLMYKVEPSHPGKKIIFYHLYVLSVTTQSSCPQMRVGT